MAASYRRTYEKQSLVHMQYIAICNVPEALVVGEDAEDGGTPCPSALVWAETLGTEWQWRRQHECSSRNFRRPGIAEVFFLPRRPCSALASCQLVGARWDSWSGRSCKLKMLGLELLCSLWERGRLVLFHSLEFPTISMLMHCHCAYTSTEGVPHIGLLYRELHFWSFVSLFYFIIFNRKRIWKPLFF